MDGWELFAPRDVHVAKRLVVVLTAVATGITVLFALVAPNQPHAPTVSVVGPVVVLGLAIAIAAVRDPPRWVWAAYPISVTFVIAALNLASHDASVTAQVFFIFPVLYGGAQLRRRAAVVLCLATDVAEALTTFTQLDARTAVAQTAFVAAALSTATVILVYSGERVDALMSQLRDQAAIDPLTGLVTRRVLDSVAASSLESAAAGRGTALIIVDIDHFKRVNDQHGHPVGDLVLRRVSDTLRAGSRTGDVVCRMGGDELAILMPGCALADAERRAGDLVLDVRTLRVEVPRSDTEGGDGADELPVTVSVGLAHLPTHATDVQALYRAADVSLYLAKRAGRDRVGAEGLTVNAPRSVSSPAAV